MTDNQRQTFWRGRSVPRFRSLMDTRRNARDSFSFRVNAPPRVHSETRPGAMSDAEGSAATLDGSDDAFKMVGNVDWGALKAEVVLALNKLDNQLSVLKVRRLERVARRCLGPADRDAARAPRAESSIGRSSAHDDPPNPFVDHGQHVHLVARRRGRRAGARARRFRPPLHVDRLRPATRKSPADAPSPPLTPIPLVPPPKTLRNAAGHLFEQGNGQAQFMIPLKARVRKYEAEVKRARADILELQGLREQDRAEMDGLREDLAVCNAGYDAEREEKAAVEAARDEASKQLEFLEAELEGVRAEESALRADVKVKTEELSDLTSARDELDDEVRRLKELSNAREIECTKLRSQLSELREQHSVALDDARRYQAESERQGERAGKLAAQTSAAMSEADKLRKWQDWAKSSEVTSLQSELEVVKQERDMLQRDLQSRLAEMRRVTQQNEEWGRDVKALRADLFAREGRLGRVEAELAALQRHSTTIETDLSVAKEQVQRRSEELQVAAMDAVKLRGKFETERLKNQSTVNSMRAAQNVEIVEMRAKHGAEMEAARRDAAAAWRLAKELEARVTQQAKMFTANNKKFSKALEIGRRLTGEEPKPPSTPVDLT